MLLEMLKSKIHRATVTQAEVDYVGSITIDEDLLDASHIIEYEKVLVANVNTGQRLETYVIAGTRGSGIICLNGAAAHYAEIGDKVIIMSYVRLTPDEAREMRPTVVFVDGDNRPTRVSSYERHGRLA